MECIKCGTFLRTKELAYQHKKKCSMVGIKSNEYINRQVELLSADIELTNLESQIKNLWNHRFSNNK